MFILHIRLGSVRISYTVGTWAGVIPSTTLKERIFVYVKLGCVMSYSSSRTLVK